MLTIHNGTIVNTKPSVEMIRSVRENPCMLVRVEVMGRTCSVNLDLREMTPDGLKMLITRAAAELNRR